MRAPRALLLINPSSGRGEIEPEALPKIVEDCGFDARLFVPKAPGEASEILLREGADAERVILGGGDGTFSRAAPYLLELGKPAGFIPLGTANDLARTLNLPQNPVDAARHAASAPLKPIDLGTVNGRPFFNVASMGFSVEVARHHDGERKRRFGLLSYPLSWLDAQRDFKPFRVRMLVDGRKRRYRSTLIAVGNGVHFGGGLMVADDASIQDGKLDVLHIDRLTPFGMLKLLPFLRFGALKRRQDVRTLRTREIMIETEPPLEINADGEIVETTPAKFGVLPGALKVAAGPS